MDRDTLVAHVAKLLASHIGSWDDLDMTLTGNWIQRDIMIELALLYADMEGR